MTAELERYLQQGCRPAPRVLAVLPLTYRCPDCGSKRELRSVFTVRFLMAAMTGLVEMGRVTEAPRGLRKWR